MKTTSAKREESLPVCPKCGWYDGMTHNRECSPQAGAAADRLAESIPIKSTKLGYGYGCLTFLFDKSHTITLRVHNDRTFSVNHVHWLGDMKVADVQKLMGALLETR